MCMCLSNIKIITRSRKKKLTQLFERTKQTKKKSQESQQTTNKYWLKEMKNILHRASMHLCVCVSLCVYMGHFLFYYLFAYIYSLTNTYIQHTYNYTNMQPFNHMPIFLIFMGENKNLFLMACVFVCVTFVYAFTNLQLMLCCIVLFILLLLLLLYLLQYQLI